MNVYVLTYFTLAHIHVHCHVHVQVHVHAYVHEVELYVLTYFVHVHVPSCTCTVLVHVHTDSSLTFVRVYLSWFTFPQKFQNFKDDDLINICSITNSITDNYTITITNILKGTVSPDF